jgi:hypothetical protein
MRSAVVTAVKAWGVSERLLVHVSSSRQLAACPGPQDPGARERRWPVDPLWREVQAVTISPAVSGVVRRRLHQATEERLVQGLQGYLSFRSTSGLC